MSVIFPSLLKASIIMLIMTTAIWIYFLRTGKASWIDVIWSYGFAIVILILNIDFYGSTINWRTLLLSVMIGIWSVRLGTYLFMRVKNENEDGRYSELKLRWKNQLKRSFLFFFLFQGILVLILSIPAFIGFLDTSHTLQLMHLCAFGLWFASFILETLSDSQLHHFRTKPENKGKVCNVGLWSLSRHPNYFFEWMMWVSYAIFASTSPFGWFAWISPLLILYFLLRVTGIPATEAQALRTRGQLYRDYQRTTSMFVPWFRGSR